jgi:hypothetical protein
MNIKTISLVVFALSLFLLNGPTAAAQSSKPGDDADAKKFEVGAQFTAIRIDDNPIALAANERRTEPGVGGRFGYNLSRHVALEAEVNFFPRDYKGFVTPLSGGRITQGLFGVKAGVRKEHFGFFGKARPGFLRYGRTVANVQFPNGNGPDPRDPFGFEFGSTTHLALDLGGVVEYYPSRRTILRLDIGDTIVRYANIPVFDPSGQLIHVTERQHNAQVSVGFGFRF